MNPLTVQSRIKSLETQISVLKAQLGEIPSQNSGTLLFSQLHGRFSKAGPSSEQEIEESKYHFNKLEAGGEAST